MNSCQIPNPSAASPEAAPTSLRPRVISHEDENGVRLQVALPGVRKEGLKLTLLESNLNLEAARGDEVPETWKTHRDTQAANRYALHVRLANRLDGTKTSASLEAGVLTLQVPVREDSKPRQIQVN